MTAVGTISGWFDEGVVKGATHMIVVCDTFDWSDYPVYVMPGEDARTKSFQYGSDDGSGLPRDERNMQKVMEVYSLALPKDAQLLERRAFHYETPLPSTPTTPPLVM